MDGYTSDARCSFPRKDQSLVPRGIVTLLFGPPCFLRGHLCAPTACGAVYTINPCSMLKDLCVAGHPFGPKLAVVCVRHVELLLCVLECGCGCGCVCTFPSRHPP